MLLTIQTLVHTYTYALYFYSTPCYPTLSSGTGGDEASIFAGDLVGIYRKYCESEGWRVAQISETVGEMGGFKTCVLQVTGDYVYSKMKYEVGVSSTAYSCLLDVCMLGLCYEKPILGLYLLRAQIYVCSPLHV